MIESTTTRSSRSHRPLSAQLPQTGGVTLTVSLQYDPFGRRIQKNSAAATTFYAYDGANIVGEYNAAGALGASYTQGAGIDEPLALRRGGYIGYYHADGLGSITSLSSPAGAPIATYSYDSFGRTTSTEGIFNPFRYTGREHDTETGLYYYRARYYDPAIGRFISEDPVRFWGGVDFYKYVDNLPLKMVDPYGLKGSSTQPTLLPRGGFIVYGNWCGPNWTGGRNEEYYPSHDRDFYYADPINELDGACKEHDICFSRCRRSFSCDQAARTDCMRQCNANLGHAASRLISDQWDIFTTPAGIIGSIMSGHDPDPGTNEHCGCKK